MTVKHAKALSNRIDKTLSREQTAGPANAQNAKFGIKAKLFLAFFSLAALTALASGVAWYVFRDIDRAVARVTLESIPGIIAALSSAEKSAEIAAAAPALMAVGSQEERVSEESKIERETTTKTKELNSAVEKRLRLETERQAGTKLLSSAHADFLVAIEPLIDDSVFNLVTRGEDVTA